MVETNHERRKNNMKKRYQIWERIQEVTIQLFEKDGKTWLLNFNTMTAAKKWAKDNGYEAYGK